jgi:hypothetical protein
MKKKLKCYNKYFINGHVFYTEEYVQAKKKHITMGFVLREQFLKSLKLTTMRN